MNEMLVKFFASIGFTTTDATNFNITNSPVQEGEKVLTDMNLLEKTCFMFLESKKTEHQEMHEQVDGCENVEDLTKLGHKHDLLQDTTNVVRSMMWASIKSRTPREVGSIGYGVRDGNQIVALFKEEDDEDDFLSKILNLGGMMVIG